MASHVDENRRIRGIAREIGKMKILLEETKRQRITDLSTGILVGLLINLIIFLL